MKLPAAWRTNFERQGPEAPWPKNDRRFARVHCRSHDNVVALESRQSLPGLPRPALWHAVYLSDFSRGGVGLVHGEQLFPCERMRLALPTGLVQWIEVTRCQRVDERCYVIGATFLDAKSAAQAQTG